MYSGVVQTRVAEPRQRGSAGHDSRSSSTSVIEA